MVTVATLSPQEKRTQNQQMETAYVYSASMDHMRFSMACDTHHRGQFMGYCSMDQSTECKNVTSLLGTVSDAEGVLADPIQYGKMIHKMGQHTKQNAHWATVVSEQKSQLLLSMKQFVVYPFAGSHIGSGVIDADGAAHVLSSNHYIKSTFRNVLDPDDPFEHISLGKRSVSLLTRKGVLMTAGFSFDGIRAVEHWPQHTFDWVLQKGCINEEEAVIGGALSSPPRFVQLASGSFHGVALSESGHVYVWGRNNYAQCAQCPETHSHFSKATLVASLPEPTIAIAACRNSTLALSKSFKLYAWGASNDPTIRTMSFPHNETPIKVSACGFLHFAVLTDRGNVYVFNEGIGCRESHVIKSDRAPQIVDISMGLFHLNIVEQFDKPNQRLVSDQATLTAHFLSFLTNRDNDQSSDVTIVFRGVPYRLHRALLIARSALFDRLLSDESKITELDVTDIVPASTTEAMFDAAIKFIYCANVGDDRTFITSLAPVIQALEVRTQLYDDSVVYNLQAEFVAHLQGMITTDEREASKLGADLTITLLSSNTKYYVHKFILAKRSAYFRAMLESGMMESHSSTIEVEDVSDSVMHVILEYVYSSHVDKTKITIDNCIEAMLTANQYSENGLCTVIENHVARLIDYDTVDVLLDFAQRFEFKYLDDRCQNFLKRHALTIKNRASVSAHSE